MWNVTVSIRCFKKRLNIKSTDSPARDRVKRLYSCDEARGGDKSHRKVTEKQGNEKRKQAL